jgi:hypothetical protein
MQSLKMGNAEQISATDFFGIIFKDEEVRAIVFVVDGDYPLTFAKCRLQLLLPVLIQRLIDMDGDVSQVDIHDASPLQSGPTYAVLRLPLLE